MSDYVVRLDQLKNYEGGDSATPLFHRAQRLVYPVRADGQTRSSLQVVRRGNDWTLARFGASRIHLLLGVRAAAAAAEGRPPAEYFRAIIPALNLTFIGRSDGGNVFLTPIADSPRFGFVKGATLPAENVFNAVVPAARMHDGLPS